jgi:hypothetical protein
LRSLRSGFARGSGDAGFALGSRNALRAGLTGGPWFALGSRSTLWPRLAGRTGRPIRSFDPGWALGSGGPTWAHFSGNARRTGFALKSDFTLSARWPNRSRRPGWTGGSRRTDFTWRAGRSRGTCLPLRTLEPRRPLCTDWAPLARRSGGALRADRPNRSGLPRVTPEVVLRSARAEIQVSFRSDGRHRADLRTRRIAALARCAVPACFCTQAWMTFASAEPTCAARPKARMATKLDAGRRRNALFPNFGKTARIRPQPRGAFSAAAEFCRRG